ncbi:MAG: HNH endonuclease signature motif containing protein, partial [Acidimicrobiales bacterium]
DDDPTKPPREDEFYHSETGGRYFSKGSFGSVTGTVINTAIKLAETDNPRDNDTRSPAERRGEALADVCNFYVDYKNRIAADPDADAAAVPKKRNWPHLIGVNTTGEMANRAGAQLLDGPRIDHQAYEALSCTAQLLRLLLDADGAIRSYDMMPASVTDALFGAIAARDQHCRWPGCHKEPIHCDVHHLHHRENGGVNSPCNCCLLCKYHHHRAAHDPKIRMVMEPDGTLHITYADGTTETTIPPIRQPGFKWAS